MKTISLFIALFLTVNLFSQEFETARKAFEESYAFEKKSEFLKAIEVIKKISNISTFEYECNLRLGWLSYSAGLSTESMAYYQKAMSLRPLSIEAKMGYVVPAAQVGNWDAVLAQYLKILETDSSHPTANFRTGSIYYGRKDYEKASKYFEKVVNLYPFDYDSMLMLAWTNFQLGKSREAKILFNKVLLYNPTDASALEGLSYIK